MSAESSARAIRNFLDDPKRSVPLAVGSGLLKGAVVGILIGQMGVALALGLGGGAVAGGVLAWRSAYRTRGAKARQEKPH